MATVPEARRAIIRPETCRPLPPGNATGRVSQAIANKRRSGVVAFRRGRSAVGVATLHVSEFGEHVHGEHAGHGALLSLRPAKASGVAASSACNERIASGSRGANPGPAGGATSGGSGCAPESGAPARASAP